MNLTDMLVIIFFFSGLAVVFIKFLNFYKLILEPMLKKYSRGKNNYEPLYPIPFILLGFAFSLISWLLIFNVLSGHVLITSNNTNNSVYFAELQLLTTVHWLNSVLLVISFVLSVAELFSSLSRYSFSRIKRYSDYAQKRR